MARRKRIRTHMTKTIPAATARTQFGQILELVQTKGTRFVVSRNGQPAAIILAIEDFLESIGELPASLNKLQAVARKRRLNLLTLKDVDEEVTAVRTEKRKKNPRRA